MTRPARQPKHAQAGIAIGPILFIVAILAILVGAIAAGSGGFGSSTTDEAARVRASTIIQQAVSIKSAFDRVLVSGAVPSAVIAAEAPTTTTSPLALYGVLVGTTAQIPPRDAVVTGASWRFVVDADLPGIGAPGNNDAITIVEVSLPTCNALNELIFGRGQYVSPPALTGTVNVAIASIGPGDNVIPATNAFDSSVPPAAIQGRSSACVASGGYYYYQLLAAG